MHPVGTEARFRALFAEEASGRLEHLGGLALELEERGAEPALVDDLFREAHSLKGSAAVVGFTGVAQVAHALEDQLDGLRRGTGSAAAVAVSLLVGIDGLRELVPVLVAGHDGGEAGRDLERRVREAALPPAAGASPSADVPPAIDAALSVAPPEPPPAPVSSPAGEPPPAPEMQPPVEVPPATAAAAAEVAGPASTAPVAPPAFAARADGTNGSAPVAPPAAGAVVRLPLERLDEFGRLVGEAVAAHRRVGHVLSGHLGGNADASPAHRELSLLLDELQDASTRARMVPVATVTGALRRAVRDAARTVGREVRWEVRGEDTAIDRGVLEQLADPLLHVVRNAVAHGIEPPGEREAMGKPRHGFVRLHAMQLGAEVVLSVSDDGRGIDAVRLRAEAAKRGIDVADMDDDAVLQLIFRPGVSTAGEVSAVSGRGVGLDVVHGKVLGLRGRVEVRTTLGRGTELRLRVPVTLAVQRSLLVMAAGRRYAIPLHSVVNVLDRAAMDDSTVLGRPVTWVGNRPVHVSNLADVVGDGGGEPGHAVVLSGPEGWHAFRVDALAGQRDTLVKALSGLVPPLELVAGASVEPDGAVVPVLDPAGLVRRAEAAAPRPAVVAVAPGATVAVTASQRTVLVVDDALTVRELQRTILERAGHAVVTAADGVLALARLAEGGIDLVVTDVEMPNMDGFTLTERIRTRRDLASLPVIIVSSRADEADRRRGLEAGADAYVVKSAFDERVLLDALDRLLGPL